MEHWFSPCTDFCEKGFIVFRKCGFKLEISTKNHHVWYIFVCSCNMRALEWRFEYKDRFWDHLFLSFHCPRSFSPRFYSKIVSKLITRLTEEKKLLRTLEFQTENVNRIDLSLFRNDLRNCFFSILRSMYHCTFKVLIFNYGHYGNTYCKDRFFTF